MTSEVLIDGRRLTYLESGDGPPVLFLPGLGNDAGIWEPQMEELKKSFRCLSVNHRGIGGSDCGPDGFTLADLAEDAVRLLDALEIAAAHVVGASMGGVVAQLIALRHPEHVQTLSLHSTWSYTGARLALSFSMQKMLLDHVDVATLTYSLAPMIWSDHTLVHRREVIEQFRERRAGAETAAAEVYRRQIDALLDFDVRSELSRIDAPILVTHGEEDILVPSSCADEIIRACPTASILRFPMAGHATFLEYTESFNQVQSAFLAREEL